MSRECTVCGKGTAFGIKYARRGAAKKKGGSGAKISGKTARTFKPNLQNVRALVGGTPRQVRVCASCLQAGKVQKAPRGMGKKKIAA